MRLPIRLRLAAWHGALTAAILLGLGAFLVLQLRTELQGRLDAELRTHAGALRHGYADDGREEFLEVAAFALPRPGGAAQALEPAGRVVAAYGAAPADRPLVPAAARRRAMRGERLLLTLGWGRPRQRYRTSVSTVRRGGERHVVVVAEAMRGIDATLQHVLLLLSIAGPVALVATGLVGWWVARKALLPVERMIAQARLIEIDRLHERIAVPRVADELSHLATTLNDMLDRLERRVQENRRLVGDASHEFRTPLAVMRTELDVSLRGDELPEEAREVLQSAREEVDRMTRTLEKLLPLAQLDEGLAGLAHRRLDLREAIVTAAEPLRPFAERKDIDLDLRGEPSVTEADPERVHQALTNLIENAIKFTPPDGHVTVRAWDQGHEVGVTVADDGPGIPATARQQVFERFYRVDRSRGRGEGGSGLGLAIVREIVVAHGGRVWVESEEGRGSAFSFALPRRGTR